MFMDHILNSGSTPLLQKMMDFTAARHDLIAENIVNISTPGYVQKDYSVANFQHRLQDRLASSQRSGNGSPRFDDIQPTLGDSNTGMLFHDRGNRSAEQMMSDLSSNALRHNLYAELLRKQFDSMKSVLSERV